MNFLLRIFSWMGFQEESSFFVAVSEDVHKFPGSGIGVMDSNAAKEMIHSCPIATYEAPINGGSPGLGGRSWWEEGSASARAVRLTDLWRSAFIHLTDFKDPRGRPWSQTWYPECNRSLWRYMKESLYACKNKAVNKVLIQESTIYSNKPLVQQ